MRGLTSAQQIASQLYQPNLQLVVDNEKALEEYEVACRPVRCTSQELAVTSPADVTLYYGNRGGGKSYSMLLNFARGIDKGYGIYYRGLLLGYEYQSLNNVITMSHSIFARLAGARFYASQQYLHWRFRCGEELQFGHCKTVADYESKVHGNSYAWLGVEESTNWDSPEIIDKVASTLRTGFKPSLHSADKNNPAPPLNPRMIMVANPSGPGTDWHKDRFIDGHKLGVISSVDVRVPILTSKGMRFIVEKTTQVALFSSFVENPFLTPITRAKMIKSCLGDPVKFAQWILGSWDVTTDGALDDVFKRHIHVLSPFVVPPTWYVDRTHDWGSKYPSATVWFAESDGSEVSIGGKKRTFPRGTLFVIEELYTSTRPGYNEGTYATVSQVCQMIQDTERAMKERGIISVTPAPGPADNTIHHSAAEDIPTIGSTMADYGVHWNESDRSPGARINGLQLVRNRLRAANGQEDPALYVCSNCVNVLKLVPSIRRDARLVEDTDKNSEDHLYDAIRYRVLEADRFVSRPVRFAV